MNTGKNGLSRRLQAVADLVSPGKRVCDVGCDHGYVSIYLIESGRADAVLAMDVNRGPLERARINVEKHGLTGYITLRLSNAVCGIFSSWHNGLQVSLYAFDSFSANSIPVFIYVGLLFYFNFELFVFVLI